MFLLELFYQNTRLNGSGEICFYPVVEKGEQEKSGRENSFTKECIKKWTFLSGGIESTELLKLIAVPCIGYKFLPRFAEYLDLFDCSESDCTEENSCLKAKPVLLESHQIRHSPRDCHATVFPYYASGLKIVKHGKVVKFRADEYQYTPVEMPKKHPRMGSGIREHFILAYGSLWEAHSGTDCFDFSQPDYRTVRLLSLFTDDAFLTDPIVFLQRLHYRMLKGRKPAINTLKHLCTLVKKYFFINSDTWLDRDIDFKEQWLQLKIWQKKLLIPILDMVRHAMDASPHDLNPCARTGMLLLALPEKFCPKERFVDWLTTLDDLFPNMQFIVSLSNAEIVDEMPAVLTRSTLALLPCHKKQSPPTVTKPSKFTKNTVVLIDVDSRMPNLALMKLSSHFKQQGRKVVLARHDKWNIESAKEVYASSIFNFNHSLRRVASLRKKFGERVTIGGSGVDIKLRLAEEIELLPADFELYPELGDRAIGFLTRGCPRKCPFCLVSEKEGEVRQVALLDDLLQQRNKLILLDDNILAHPEVDKMLEEMVAKNIRVNFNQSLDILMLTRERAGLLKKIGSSNVDFKRINYSFSLNGNSNFEQVRRNYGMFYFKHRDNVKFICMYGYDTTLAEDVERFLFIRSLPGASVFVQQYKPVIGRVLTRNEFFFNDQADQLIDQLIKILFPQNMKSMEQYYRWLSALYFEKFGKFHFRLVDTIFRYNFRDQKHQYMATMKSRAISSSS